MTAQAPTPSLAVAAACESAALVGHELQTQLARDIPAKILLRQARDVVLLSGPTGSGKEKIASAAHDAAAKWLGRKGELVQVNCANLGRGLFESELFGYKRGAFTGADSNSEGLVSRAQNGTLVLDEVQALTPNDQARLLRFLGEREYRPVGEQSLSKTDALIILASNQDLRSVVDSGEFRRDLLDRATAKIKVPALYERRADIGDLAQAFALEAAAELDREDFHGLTRRARRDVEQAIVLAREVSVRRLREIIRDAVFMAAADVLPDAIESDYLTPILALELGFDSSERDHFDRKEIRDEFEVAVGRTRLAQLAKRHGVSLKALDLLSRAVRTVIDEMDDQPRSYRNVVERAGRLSKVALWLVSGAQSQADFRRFFGSLDAHMPTKSVAHQIYHEVFHDEEEA